MRLFTYYWRGRHGRDRMMVGFITSYEIIAKVVSSNPVHGEVHWMQHYVITFVSEVRQVSGFLLILRFPPPTKLAATI